MWNVLEGPHHNYIDGRTHVHHVHLFNQVTGGEHEIQLLLHTPVCRECNRPFPQSDLGGLDPYLTISQVLSDLTLNHGAIMKYIQKHGIPVKLGPKANYVPPSHKLTTHGEIRMLHPPREK
jgi:hypothetical protein